MAFYEGGVEAMRINSSGQVGIGTSIPSYNLDVRGTVGTNSDITIEDPSNTNTVGYGVGRGKIISNGAGGFGGLTFQTYNGGFLNQATIDGNGVFGFNSGFGSVATAYGCRAWVNFNGTSGGSIRGSGNIASVVKIQGGIYYVTFTNNMPDTNFCFVGSASVSPGNFGLVPGDEISERTVNKTGSFYTVNAASVNNAADANNINIAIFR
jgi:hypothetical protein